MPESCSEPPSSIAGLAARLAAQADGLGTALRLREHRAADGPEQDHGLHNLANRLVAIVATGFVPAKQLTEEAVARLVRGAEPLREALLLREDIAAAAAGREVDWELHSLAYRVLTTVDLIGINYPNASLGGSLLDDHLISVAVTEAVTCWPQEQRTRFVEELVHSGVKLPDRLAAALRPGTTA
ncbi:hypothetical protein WKI65_42955 [Streptomyces sp. MS1.AVA.3]|uniref:hypothetical protein n=1 Tax=Streptomyces decoyicus TaxID=249567 RepID=UPI0030BDB093